jgi:hypothetical protein
MRGAFVFWIRLMRLISSLLMSRPSTRSSDTIGRLALPTMAPSRLSSVMTLDSGGSWESHRSGIGK